MREAWTDERLDDLNRRVGEVRGEMRAGFGEARKDTLALRAEMSSRIDGVNERLDGVQRSMVQLTVPLTTAMVAGFAGIFAVLVAKL